MEGKTGESIVTNRDLYLAVAALIAREEGAVRPLGEYLRALLALGEREKHRQRINPAKLFSLISAAFHEEALLYDFAWEEVLDQAPPGQGGFEGWRLALIGQIVDLHQLEEEDLLEYEYRYFGMDSPRGSRWFNFDASTYLECATAGIYGGWQPGDSLGRAFVSGQDPLPEGIETRTNPVFAVEPLTWETFRDFLLAGQLYE